MAERPYVSDELTHFVARSAPDDEARFDVLLKILRSGRLLPRPSTPDAIPTTKIDPQASFVDQRMYDPAVVCFCDIPRDGMALHMRKYSQFGIAFAKVDLAMAGASPVFYVAKNSAVRDNDVAATTTRGEYLDKMIPRAEQLLLGLEAAAMTPLSVPATIDGEVVMGVRHARDDNPIISLGNLLRSEVFPFIVPFDERLPHDHIENYYMEREWRTKGSIQFESKHVRRLIMPAAFIDRFRAALPAWNEVPIHRADTPHEPPTSLAEGAP